MLFHDDGDFGSFDKPEIDLDGLWRLAEDTWHELGDPGVGAIVEDIAQLFDTEWASLEHVIRWRMLTVPTPEQ